MEKCHSFQLHVRMVKFTLYKSATMKLMVGPTMYLLKVWIWILCRPVRIFLLVSGVSTQKKDFNSPSLGLAIVHRRP